MDHKSTPHSPCVKASSTFSREMGSNFFSRISERKNHKKQQKDDFLASFDGNDKSCTPSHSFEKIVRTPQRTGSRKSNTTPVKNSTKKATPVKNSTKKATPVKNSTKKAAAVKGVINNVTKDALPSSGIVSSQSIPNLRLEAKTTAEENSRIFAGKEIHPFFSAWKGAKRCREIPEPDNHGSYPDITEAGVPFGPIHVYEKSSEEDVLLNWKEWIFYENSSINLNCGQEGGFLLDRAGSVQPLSWDNLFRKEECTNLVMGENSVENGGIGVASIGNDIHSCFRSSHGEETMPFTRNQVDSSNQHEYDMWANKYVPTKAEEVCGNADSVKFLNEWLCFWYNKDADGCNGYLKSNTQSLFDDDCCWHESGSDSTSTNDDDRPQNVMLITGPSGCGKSAAIYACAKEQGFQILELNTSDWRNGAYVKLRIGEALESHSVKWTLENSTCLQAKDVKRSLFPYESETIEPLPLTDSLGPTDCNPASTENKVRGDRDDKILIIFEDVDVLFDEDRGFLNAIVQLADTTKRPVILTSNCETPSLPHSLSSLHVSFSAPSHSELLTLFRKVCALEGVDVQTQTMRRILCCCNGDMRKTMMQFQYWSLFANGGMFSKIQRPPLFGIDTGYRLLPKIMPWSLQSQLAEIVEQEISRSLCVEETHNVVDLRGEGLILKAGFLRDPLSRDVKGAALTLGGIFDDCSRHVTFSEKVPEPSISMLSFVADTLKNDDKESADTGHTFFPDVPFGRTVDVPIGQLYGCDMNALHSYSRHFSGNQNSPLGPGRSMSAEVSYVPESLFIPDTENCGGTLSLTRPNCSPHDSNVLNDISSGIFARNSYPSEEPANFSKFFRFREKSDLTLDPICNLNREVSSAVVEEGVGDSQFFDVDVVSSGYLAMDECSRIDFGGMFRSSVENPSMCRVCDDTVGRAWGRLHARRTELGRFISEERDRARIVLLASEMSTLFSEADVFSSTRMFSLGSGEYHEVGFRPEDQPNMMLTAVEHGFCYYTEHIFSLLPNPKAAMPRLDLTSEIDTELFGYNRTSGTSCSGENFEAGFTSSNRKDYDIRLQNTVRSVAPTRAYMSLKGVVVQEYFSALKQISKSEAFRLSENSHGATRKRSRAAPHYLMSGEGMMCVEDLSLLQAGRFHN